ncbi:hypothetical protein [Streptomyces sp. S.PB5]|uniref:hypothetical protein n=1 Tax=Streptomyces sp. S.PB5 TaxID=3020844 RepID=UPI0025AF6E10|nr:hypothetical protein [Streptomyces sp. S.PB5]MDN3024668.1 hypothetical protein [Streptomyces sp. S.PB5]
MTRRTPPRPLDVPAHFPELAPLARTTIRLHPRPGAPTPTDSSIGGPLLWPTADPWPTCPDHTAPAHLGHTPDDIHRRRRILAEAHNRPRAEGADFLTEEERTVVDRASTPRRLPQDGPVPLIPVAQLYARDVPGLPRPPGTDLLQLLWCPFGHESPVGPMPHTVLRWRASAHLVDPITDAPRPSVIGHDRYLPEPCVLHPEPVTEYPAPHELPDDLADRVEDWAEEHGADYQYDLSVAPGCKVAGHAPWSYTDPFPMSCEECGSDVRPLLTIDGWECDGGSRSWFPLGDTGSAWPTHLSIGRDHALQLYVCVTSYDHPHLRNIQ